MATKINPDTAFDIVIVGGGSAGAVLANRLSADGKRRVLLLEAGEAYHADKFPDVIANANQVAGDFEHVWAYHTQDGQGPLGHDVNAVRGKVLGGSSGINAAVAMRSRPQDFERWTARGIKDWSWDDVLPVFKDMENTPTGDDAYHGRTGPFPVRQTTMDYNTPSMRAFVKASEAVGLARVSDFNGAEQNGVSPYPLNVVDGHRINTGMAYLTDEVRARPTLTVRGGAEVDNVIMVGRHATGVRLVGGETIAAGQVILSAGAFGSPAILMRSGIGPADHLEELGIPVVMDAPVGARLMEHPFYYNVYVLKKEQAEHMTPAAGAIIWTNSSEAENGELDLHISGTHFFPLDQSPTGAAIVLASAVTLPKSIGNVRLASRDPKDMPLIRYNFFDDPGDMRRMIEAVRLSRKIGRSAPFAELVEFEMLPGKDVSDDDASLERAIRAIVDGYAHPTSTIPMGPASDHGAIVDENGAVRGIEGLHVIDASIIPEVPSVATNLTTIMLAEAISRRLLGANVT